MNSPANVIFAALTNAAPCNRIKELKTLTIVLNVPNIAFQLKQGQRFEDGPGPPNLTMCGTKPAKTDRKREDATITDNLFAYGTLMCDDILQAVAGCGLTGEPGTLRGYCRRGVKGEHYPALIPEANSCVDGILYRDVPQAAWERLDRFEGEMYIRRQVPIELGDSKTVAAYTYIVKPGFMDLLEATEWDFSEFLRRGKARFQKHCKGYGAL